MKKTRSPKSQRLPLLILVALLHGALCQAANPVRELARQHTVEGRYPAAVAAYRRLLGEFPGDVELLVEAAQAHGYADLNEEARVLYRAAMQAAPERRHEWLPAYAWQTLWSGHAGEAAVLFGEASVHAPDDVEAWRGLAEACAAQGLHDGAEHHWRRVLARQPDNLAATVGLGWALLWQDRHAEAEQRFASVLRSDPKHAGARLGLAQTRNFAGRHRAAVLAFDALAGMGNDGGAQAQEALNLPRAQAARAQYWAGYADAAMPLLDRPRDADERWLRDYRVGREVRPYGWVGLEDGHDADGLHSAVLSAGAGWRRNGAELLELTARRLRLRGVDQGLQSMYGDLVRADGDGMLQALEQRTVQLQAALAGSGAAQPGGHTALLAGALSVTLPDKFATVFGQQRVGAVAGLGQVQTLLNSALFAQMRQLAAAGDEAGLVVLLRGAAGARMLENLRRAAATAMQGRPDATGRLEGRELFGTYTWRLGGVRDPAGTLWASLGLGVRDYGDWRTLAWKARARYVPADLWTLDAEAGDGTVETPAALRNHVRYRSAALGLRHTPTPRLKLAATGALLRFDDGNLRRKLAWQGDYLVWSKARLRLGWEGNRFSDSRPWEEALANRGYYNPEGYREHRWYASVEGDAGPWSYFAKAGAGRYRESGPGGVSDGNASAVEGVLAYDVAPAVRLRASAGRSNSAAGAGGGQGYWRKYAGISLTGWF